MPALTVSSSIVGTTMGRTFSAVPYTYLKRGVYYFVRRIPSDLQTFYRTDRVILSLRTKSLHRASRASERLSSRLDDYWLGIRLQKMDIPAIHLVKANDNVDDSSPLISDALDLYLKLKGEGKDKTFIDRKSVV